MRSNQDICKGHADSQDWRLGADQIRENGGRSGRSTVHEIYDVSERYFPRPVLSFIMLIGPVLARQWYLEGLRTLDDVRNRKNGIKLSSHQEVCGYSHSV